MILTKFQSDFFKKNYEFLMFIVNAFIIPHHLLFLNLDFLKTIKFLQMIHVCNDINMDNDISWSPN
jgi:hypothetical protein